MSSEPGPSSELGSAEERRIARATWGFVALGVSLRVASYLLDFPIWWDEAFVGVNLLKRGYLGLLKPLDYGQVAPLLFLWAELSAVKVLGFSEWSLRLVPLIGSVASVFVFRAMAGQVVRGRAVMVAVAIFAVSVHPIRHASDVKPYATDLLAACVLQWLALRWLSDRDRAGRLWILTMVSAVALMASHPSVFVAGGIGLAVVLPAIRTRRPSVWLGAIAYGAVSLSVYAVFYAMFARGQASAAAPRMAEMWVKSFPPLDSAVGLVGWLIRAHSGDMMAYPCGGERGRSTASLALALVGVVVLSSRKQGAMLAVLLGPLGLGLVAAAMRRYPYGGPAPDGSAARVMQYAAPALCLLVGVGASWLIDRLRANLRDRIYRIGLAALVVVGLVPIGSGLARPYRSFQAEAARTFARRFWPEVESGAEVACLRRDLGVGEWDSVHLDIAVMLCDQAIYSPSRRRGGPDWSRVSESRPLRCVLGSAPERDSPKLVAWLKMMKARYELRSRRRISVETAEPGRISRPEFFDVFEFVPKGLPAQPPSGS